MPSTQIIRWKYTRISSILFSRQLSIHCEIISRLIWIQFYLTSRQSSSSLQFSFKFKKLKNTKAISILCERTIEKIALNFVLTAEKIMCGKAGFENIWFEIEKNGDSDYTDWFSNHSWIRQDNNRVYLLENHLGIKNTISLRILRYSLILSRCIRS